MSSFQKLNQSHPRYARFFKKLVERELKDQKKQDQVLNRIARNFHAARQPIKNRTVDLFAVKSVELLEDLLYKTHRDSKVERYAKDALSGIARRRGVLNGPGRERALKAFGRIMDLKLSYEEKQQQFFKGISAVKTSEGLADMLENLLDSETMEKVADSRAVVEYDDGRMALVWIPDFETSNKVGSHEWCISRSDGGETYWNDHAEGLNKCYMIVDRALPASHGRHKFAFHIGPDGNVTASHDQFDEPIDAKTDKGFQQALKLTGARPFNYDEILQSADESMIDEYVEKCGDPVLLSKKVLTASNPAEELGKRFKALKNCTAVNLPSCRRLVFTAARRFSQADKESVMDLPFINSIYIGNFIATHSDFVNDDKESVMDLPFVKNLYDGHFTKSHRDIVATLVAMMPSLAAAKKHLAAEAFEFTQGHWEKKQVIELAILFDNRPLLASLFNNSWEMPSATEFFRVKSEKILSLGAKINRLLLDSGFQPDLHYISFSSVLLFPSSQAERESAEVYFSTPRVRDSSKFANYLCLELENRYLKMGAKQAKGNDWHEPVLDHLPWVLENLKRVLGGNSERYAQQIGTMLSLVAGENSVEAGVVRYLPQISLLLDEVDRLERDACKKTLSVLAGSLGAMQASIFASRSGIEIKQKPLPEDSRALLGRLLLTMQNYGADMPMVYMSLLAREGDFDRITGNGLQGKKAFAVDLHGFLRTVMGRPERCEGRFPEQWLTDADAWLQCDRSWFDESDRSIVGRFFNALRGQNVSEKRLNYLLKMATGFISGNPSLEFSVPAPYRRSFTKRARREDFYSESFDNAEVFAEFLHDVREIQGEVLPQELSDFLHNASKSVQAWAFSVGWDDVMSVVGDKGNNYKTFIDDLLGERFCDRETFDPTRAYPVSGLVIGMAKDENDALASLAESVERTVPGFNSRAFANAVNQFHGTFSSGDIVPLKDSNASEPSFV